MRRPTLVFAITLLSLPDQALANPLAWLFKSVGSAVKTAPKLAPSAVPKIGGGMVVGKEGATLVDDASRSAARAADDIADDSTRIGAESNAADDAAKAGETEDSLPSKIGKDVGQEALENMLTDQPDSEKRESPQVDRSQNQSKLRPEELPVLMRVPSLTLSPPTSPLARNLLKEPAPAR